MKAPKIYLKFIEVFFIVCFFSCNNTSEKPVLIDFNSVLNDTLSDVNTDSSKPLKVAVSTMISPKETFKYYKELFQYISEKIGRKVLFKQKKTYQEVNNMLVTNKVDIAFICSGAYIQKSDEMNLLVAPVCNGKTYYQAYVIANKVSDIDSFKDFKNKSFAYTDVLSNTGKFYAQKKIKDIDGIAENFFSKIIYSHAHDISIQLVAKQVVDGATIDGLIYEYEKKFYPDKVKNIKIIEKSEMYGIPPIVTSFGVQKELQEKLKNILLNMHNDVKGRKILENILIDKFIVVNDTIYDNVRTVQNYICK